MQEILEAIQGGASGDEIAALPIPESYRAAHVRRAEQDMWEGVPSEDKDPRKSLHVGEVATPELAPDEVYLAVMASSINFNTVWTSIFEPLSTFGFLDRLGRESVWGARHAQDFHVVGSDASAVVLRVGSAVRNWKPGDRVSVHCNFVDDQDPSAHDDSMLAANQRIWGFESNFGGLADLSVVKANQLMPKPAHLTWEEAAVNGLCASTSYRMLVGKHAARMKQGDNVFIWGATGGIGAYATQLVLNGGGTPIGVVSSEDPARQTMGASVFITKRGGTIVTCAATSGFMIEYDNRHLWMKLKSIVSSHFANYQEAWEMNRLIDKGAIQPVMSAVFPLEQVGEAARAVHRNEAEGKLGVLCLAPEAGPGVSDPEKRERIGEDKITLFQRHARGEL